MSEKLTKMQRERYEWGEIERDAAQLRDFSIAGGWLARFWTWVEGKAREGREDVEEDMRDERRRALEERESHEPRT